jgi:hypothetical protein
LFQIRQLVVWTGHREAHHDHAGPKRLRLGRRLPAALGLARDLDAGLGGQGSSLRKKTRR